MESVVTIGASAAILSAIIFGKLMEKLSFKFVGIIGCTCIAVGGLTPIFIHSSVNWLLIFAVVTGFGTGTITTLLPSLESHFFHGKQLAGLLGKVMAMEDGSSMIVIYIGGLLAIHGWVRNYWIYSIAVLTLLLVICLVPSEHVTDVKDNDEERKMKEGAKQNLPIIFVWELIGFLSIFLIAIMSNKLAIYISAFHLGSSDAAGLALMFNSGSSIFIGLLINPIRVLFKRFTIPVGFVIFAIGALLFITTRSLPIVCLAAFLVGSGSAVSLATCPFMLSKVSDRKHYPLVMGIFSASTSLGFTSSTWFFRMASDMFGISPLMGSFWGMLIISLMTAALLVIFRLQKRTESHYLYE